LQAFHPPCRRGMMPRGAVQAKSGAGPATQPTSARGDFLPRSVVKAHGIELRQETPPEAPKGKPMKISFAFAAALLLGLAGNPALAITSKEKMDICNFGADDQKLSGSARKTFINKCMAKGDEPGTKPKAKPKPKPKDAT